MKFLILFHMFFILAAGPNKGPHVWGKIIKTEESVHNLTSKYFVVFEEDGKTQAYPIEPKDNKMKSKILENLGKSVKIHGDVKKVTLQNDGLKQEIIVFVPENLEPLTLADLSANNPSEIESTFSPDKKKEYSGGGIRVSDKVANTLIYTGGAIILGTKILEMINKKK